MALGRLDICAVRNLADISLQDLQSANIFYGENGSGKTSVLESVYLLGTTRSFRSTQIKSVINHQAKAFLVRGELLGEAGRKVNLGVRRDRQGGLEARAGGQRVLSAANLAAQLPVQVVNAQSFELLTGTPSGRRRYLDWGVFHVEPAYHETWRRFQRCARQRNKLLRRGRMQTEELAVWNREFAATGERLDTMRKAYLAGLLPVFAGLAARLSPRLADIEVRYRRGWEANRSLADALQASTRADLEQGFTHAGPQRADLRLLADGHEAGAILSRGQQKLVVCALKLAQGQVFGKQRSRECVYLLDDLPSELDEDHCRRVCEVLGELKAQVFLTCVKRDDILKHWPRPPQPAMFHVKHGTVERLS